MIDPTYDKWIQEDAHIVGYYETQWNPTSPTCTHLDTCKDIWEYFQLLFLNNMTRMYDQICEFSHLKQDNLFVTNYFASLKRVHEELNVI